MDALSNLKAAVEHNNTLHQQMRELQALEATLKAQMRQAAGPARPNPTQLLSGEPLSQEAVDLERRLAAVHEHLRDAPNQLRQASEAAERARQRAIAASLQGATFDRARKAWSDAIEAVEKAIATEAKAAQELSDELRDIGGYLPNDPLTEKWAWLADFRSWREQRH
jgi:hypothetical protein